MSDTDATPRPDAEQAPHATDATPIELPPGEGGQMLYGGTAQAYDGMEDFSHGDHGDAANAIDRDDMTQPTGQDDTRPDARPRAGSDRAASN